MMKIAAKKDLIEQARKNYFNFLNVCKASDGQYKLTKNSDASPYALCFAIFGYKLLQKYEFLEQHRKLYNRILRNNLFSFYENRKSESTDLLTDKPLLQLLTFTLSALSVLDTLTNDPLEELVLKVTAASPIALLKKNKVFEGRAGTGNLAMFQAILLLHKRDYLNIDISEDLNQWVSLHLSSMNQFGFWGESGSMSHLQFQNGYHQYEILEYLRVEAVPWENAANAVASLADKQGHFAPYPGGGGCYDYDAVFIITAAENQTIIRYEDLLNRTTDSILDEQNNDGGFCESHYVRPRSLSNMKRSLYHIKSAQGQARVERIRQNLTLLRPKHDRIHTHWSNYSRKWSESDLWDSWFRMLTLARIEVALENSSKLAWGFINYPGIGYHPLVS